MSERPPTSTETAIPRGIGEALAAYAFGALAAEEEAVVVAYLDAHPDARRLLAEYGTIVDLLAYAAVPSDPPASLRQAVLHTIRTGRSQPRSSRGTARTWLAAAFAVGLGLALLLWHLGLPLAPQRTAVVASTAVAIFSTPGLDAYDLLPDRAAPGAMGRIYLTPDNAEAALVVAGLPALSSEQTYQLWFHTADQGAVNMGTFTVDASGTAVMTVPIPPSPVAYVSCGITREPRGGRSSPTGPLVLVSDAWESGQAG
jgi:anti-sigma-K factor RskA